MSRNMRNGRWAALSSAATLTRVAPIGRGRHTRTGGLRGRLSSLQGDDWLVDGPFRETDKDTLSGGDGDDVFFIDNRPATRDVVTCGGGFDRVAADAKDLVAPDCEEVDTGPTAGEDLFEQLEELGFFEIFEGLAPFPEG
jgi:hypothetical protein